MAQSVKYLRYKQGTCVRLPNLYMQTRCGSSLKRCEDPSPDPRTHERLLGHSSLPMIPALRRWRWGILRANWLDRLAIQKLWVQLRDTASMNKMESNGGRLPVPILGLHTRVNAYMHAHTHTREEKLKSTFKVITGENTKPPHGPHLIHTVQNPGDTAILKRGERQNDERAQRDWNQETERAAGHRVGTLASIISDGSQILEFAVPWSLPALIVIVYIYLLCAGG